MPISQYRPPRKLLQGALAPLVGVLLFLLGGLGVAQAFQIPTSNQDLEMYLDTSLLYNLGMRVDSQDSKIINNVTQHSSDAKFDQGDIITNRINLNMQYELLYKNSYGLLLSGDAWYDFAYSNTDVEPYPGYVQSSYHGNSYSPYTKRYYRGPGAEVLNAFLFGSFTPGGIPVNAKIGRLSVEWGPGALLAAQGISVNQQPFNIRTAVAQPGSLVSQLFLPVGQADVQANLTNNLSVSAQYFFEYETSRFPEGGTYFGGPDFLFRGPDQFVPVPGVALTRLKAKKPGNTDHPEFGIMAHWRPDWINGTLGVYYRRFNNKQPLVDMQKSKGRYRLVFPTGTDLFALSLDRNIGPAALGVEVSYLHDAALNGGVANGKGARGNVWNVDVNSIWTVGRTAFFDNASLVADVGYQRLAGLTHRANLYGGVGYGCTGDKWSGCSTKDSVQAAVNFTPTWIQVFPAWNLSLPLTANYTIYGNGATLAASGTHQGAITYSAGVQAQYRSKYTATLTYADSFAHYHEHGGVVTDGNGSWYYNDRGRVTLSLAASF